jgi:anti-sigma factor RsiW
MKCEQIEPWISADQDGELDARRSRILQEHLACCSACRALSEEGEALALALWSGLSRRAAPDTLHARVMRQIPEPEPVPVRGLRRGFWRPPGWLSFGLVPIAAVTAWLLLAPLATRPALLPGDRARAVLAEVPAPGTPAPESTAASKPALPSSAAAPRVKSTSTREPKLRAPAARVPDPRATPEPPAITRPGKPQGIDHPETEWQHRLRRLRPRRGRYPVAESPRGRWRPRRAHARLILAARPLRSPAVPDPRSPLSPITVVDYVLPEVQRPLSTPEAETDFVLRPAQAVPASATGFNL